MNVLILLFLFIRFVVHTTITGQKKSCPIYNTKNCDKATYFPIDCEVIKSKPRFPCVRYLCVKTTTISPSTASSSTTAATSTTTASSTTAATSTTTTSASSNNRVLTGKLIFWILARCRLCCLR